MKLILLILHITAGCVALMSAPVAMAVGKGNTLHRRAGILFFWSMTLVFITALLLSLVSFQPFLLMIAVLSYYAVVSGYRALYHKKLHASKSVIKPIDWFALVVNGVTNLAFVIWGITLLDEMQGIGILAIVFGTLGSMMSVSNIISFVRQPSDKMYWLYAHINGFVIGYIACTTAFSVTVIDFIPGIWAWLWPTIIGSPLIAFWIRRYKNKFKKGAKPCDVLVLK